MYYVEQFRLECIPGYENTYIFMLCTNSSQYNCKFNAEKVHVPWCSEANFHQKGQNTSKCHKDLQGP